ncbi:MAG: hypothetical protein ACRCTP_04790 [Aeromonas popoffii]|uniref:hypothetical protein n=1 Tax=Aeromonas popoffii TaxID=70856 RepID=UPI003F2D1896
MIDIKNIIVKGIEYKAATSNCFSCGPCDFRNSDCDNIPCGDDEGTDWYWTEVNNDQN